ncbi:hypothetical protein OBA27_00985 [Pelagibacteraceae bacterium]|nr:hypothetical protein [Pelagibacteraceae bacterium]
MINRYGMVPAAFFLFVFAIFFTTLFPSPHKTCIDKNMIVLNNLDREKYSEQQIVNYGKSIGTGCNEDTSYQLAVS